MMLALSVRQPFAELILSGIKTIEYRSRPTRIIGQRFYLYASKGRGAKMRLNAKPWSADLAVPGTEGSPVTPPWILELANAMKMFPMDLPTGVIVGSAVIDKVTPGDACSAAPGCGAGTLPTCDARPSCGSLPADRSRCGSGRNKENELLVGSCWLLGHKDRRLP
jgi:hypothetical protein